MFLVSLLDMPQQAARSAHYDWLRAALTFHHGFPFLTHWTRVFPNFHGLLNREHQLWLSLIGSFLFLLSRVFGS
eukprot:10713933-Karenia_brevis.AAC.1